MDKKQIKGMHSACSKKHELENVAESEQLPLFAPSAQHVASLSDSVDDASLFSSRLSQGAGWDCQKKLFNSDVAICLSFFFIDFIASSILPIKNILEISRPKNMCQPTVPEKNVETTN